MLSNSCFLPTTVINAMSNDINALELETQTLRVQISEGEKFIDRQTKLAERVGEQLRAAAERQQEAQEARKGAWAKERDIDKVEFDYVNPLEPMGGEGCMLSCACLFVLMWW